MSDFAVIPSLLGGALLGLSAATLFLFNGRVDGASGVFGGIVERRDVGWRLAFLAGLVIAGIAGLAVAPERFGPPITASLPVLLLAGFLVGFGTRMGSGCTSGHGIAGLSRLSTRSLAATVTFIATGALTVLATRAVQGGL